MFESIGNFNSYSLDIRITLIINLLIKVTESFLWGKEEGKMRDERGVNAS